MNLFRIQQPWIILAVGVLFVGAIALTVAQTVSQTVPESPYLRTDPAKIVTEPGTGGEFPCGGCHGLEYQVYAETRHAEGFLDMHRSNRAQDILGKMGFRRALNESLCLRCHYTAVLDDGEAEAIAGVSCESCHGAARDWIDVHNDYQGADHDTETPEARQQRLEASTAAGMNRPGDLYSIAANCFTCHNVPEEELVNVGGHASASDFELVEWFDQIRHNYVAAQWSNDETNRPLSPERKRVMYLIGKVLDYEYSIRGLARATDQGTYFKAMESSAKDAYRSLNHILTAEPSLTEVADILNIGKELNLAPNRQQALLAAADRIEALGQQLGQNYDGAALVALDPLVEGKTPAGSGSTSGGGGAAVAGTRPAWFPVPEFDTTVPNCGRCHDQAQTWLDQDEHGASLGLLTSARAAEIAERFGINPQDVQRGNQICTNCHGTIETGAEAEIVETSVSCESCHGPSSAYLNPHRREPGGGFELGMTQLKSADVRAANCARCHHITDEALLAAGHSSGDGYNFAEGVADINHWPDTENIERDGAYPEVAAAELSAAFQAVLSARPVPDVTVPELTSSLDSGTAPEVATVDEPEASEDDEPEEADDTPVDEPPAENTPRPIARPGQKRTPDWFATPSYSTTLPDCASCHEDAARWLRRDPHGHSRDLVGTPRALEIARNYGLSAQSVKRGDQICMNCHGTIETGAEAGPVFNPVSCESCHGPSSGYLKPHRRGGDAGFDTGLLRLKNADVYAMQCAQCHHITDQALLAAGHSSGEDYDIAEGHAQIEHWPDPEIERPYPGVDPGALTGALARVRSARPVPSVTQARLTTAEPPTSEPAEDAVRDPLVVSDSTTTEELLLMIKQRLERLYDSN